jgi:hypothetical protein
MANNSSIVGTIYADGNVTCQSKAAVVEGDAYVSSSGGEIEACTVNFDAHADNLDDVTVKRDAYYKTKTGGKVSGTSYPGSPTPDRQDLPAINLDFWRDSASAGGTISGNYAPADNSHLGPVKINGNLIMNNNVDIIVDGPIWVSGSITTGNNNSFTLNSGFGSYGTIILADNPSNPLTSGLITISNGTVINGSGQPTSHILFASNSTATADASPAMIVSNNSAGAVFYAIRGTLKLENNAGAKAMSAYRLYVSNNAEVNYVESEMGGNFSNSPSGTWRMLDGTWREVK